MVYTGKNGDLVENSVIIIKSSKIENAIQKKNGFLFEVGEVEKVVDKIVELYSQSSEVKRLGHNGKEMILRQFNIHSIVNKHKQFAYRLIS